jgi:hypothetical protein
MLSLSFGAGHAKVRAVHGLRGAAEGCLLFPRASQDLKASSLFAPC